jgi:deoxyribose-phosphate aldolase
MDATVETVAMDLQNAVLTRGQIARMVDLSAVRTDSTEHEVQLLARMARQYACACASALPCFTPLLVSLLCSQMETRVGGNVGFPAGGATTATKVAEARAFVDMGCGELDTVMNVGMLRSGHDAYVLEDIRAVIEAANGVPVKVILECYYLTDDQIRRACELCIEAGAAFVKTSTGWAPTGATLENVALIKSCVGDRIGIKAAGGIRSLETIRDMYRLGARRFGIGLRSAALILDPQADV